MPKEEVPVAAAAAGAVASAAAPREEVPVVAAAAAATAGDAGGGGGAIAADATDAAATAAAAETATTVAATAAGGTGKRVLAIDIDEVLGRFVLQLCRFHNESYGTTLTPEDFSSYYFHEVWGGSRSSADDKMREFFRSSHFLDGIPVVDGALRVLRKHAANFELHIVTSRQDILQDHTLEWVDDKYPGVFEDRLHFGNHFSESGVQRSKPELCRSIGAALIIDDNVRYATQCAEAGIPAYLFGDYAWNRTCEPLPDDVRRTVTWADVDAQLDSLLSGSSKSSASGGGGGSSSSSARKDRQQEAARRSSCRGDFGGGGTGGDSVARRREGRDGGINGVGFWRQRRRAPGVRPQGIAAGGAALRVSARGGGGGRLQRLSGAQPALLATSAPSHLPRYLRSS